MIGRHDMLTQLTKSSEIFCTLSNTGVTNKTTKVPIKGSFPFAYRFCKVNNAEWKLIYPFKKGDDGEAWSVLNFLIP